MRKKAEKEAKEKAEKEAKEEAVGRGERGRGRLSVEVVRPCSKCQFNVNKFILATNGNGNGRGHT